MSHKIAEFPHQKHLSIEHCSKGITLIKPVIIYLV